MKRMGRQWSRREFLGTATVAALGWRASARLAEGATAGAAPPSGAGKAGLMRAPEGNVKRGGVARWAGHLSTPHFDLHQGASAWSTVHLYSNLIRYNLVDGLRTIIPDLAERWEVSRDGKSYTFYLREGVTFHDGTPLGAEDVVASFTRIIFPPKGMASVMRELFDGVEAVEKVNPLAVRFTLKDPRPYLLEVFTVPNCVIYAKKTLDANNNDLRKVIAPGTGAFMHKERREGEKWVLVKNPRYWDTELPYVDGLELLHLPEWTDRGVAVLTGQADLSLNTSVEMVQEGRKRSDIVATGQVPSVGIYMLYFNCQRKPLQDLKVRRAIHLAMSHQDIIKAFGTAEGVKLSSWLPRASSFATSTEVLEKTPGYRADKTADVTEAKKLMADAGFAQGISGLDFLVSSTASNAQVLAPAIQEQLKRTLNIEAKIRVAERGVLDADAAAGKFDLCVQGTTMMITLDPSTCWNIAFKSGASRNFSRYSNPQLDRMLEQLGKETDTAKRKQTAAEVQQMLDQDPPWFTVGWTDHNVIWRHTTKGLALDKRVVSELGRIETIWLDK